MKKYGKYEKRPGDVPAKQPKVKNIMLQTYFTSLLALVLCVSMFLGTSYAWFTSEVTDVGNEIYIGTLSASLHKQNKQPTGEDDKYLDLADAGQKLFDGTVRWEPGYTMLETIQIKNEGDLAFNYVLNFTDGKLEDATANMADIAKYFDVWVYSHQTNLEAPAPASYADITAEGSVWTNAGNLYDLLEGKQVLSGTMTQVRLDENSTETANEGTTDGAPAVHTFTLALHMNEEATADVMGQKIGLNVKLVAYQLSAEKDAFQTSTYDNNIAAAANLAQLKKILPVGGEMLLMDDVTIEKAEDMLAMNTGRLDGAKHTITVSINPTEITEPVDVLVAKGGTIVNLRVQGGEKGKALVIGNLVSDLYLNNSTFGGVASLVADPLGVSEYGIYANNTTFDAKAAYDKIKEANFYLCNFKDVLEVGCNTRLENCTFDTYGVLDVSKLVGGESVTLINCTYKGVVIENAVIKVVDGQFVVESNQLELDTANRLVLKTA